MNGAILVPPEYARGRPTPHAKRRWAGGSCVIELQCDNCGVQYNEYVKRAARAEHHFCSANCYRATRNGAGNSNWRGGPAERHCKNCGKKFSTLRAHVHKGEGIYCSPRCKHIGLSIYPSRIIARRESGRRRYARERAAKQNIGTHTFAEWEALKERARFRCVKCRKKKRLTRDHIIPLSKGGGDEITNIQPLCHSCNARKQANRETLL